MVALELDGNTANGPDLGLFGGIAPQGECRDTNPGMLLFGFYARNGLQVAMSSQIMNGGGSYRGPVGFASFAAPITDPALLSTWGGSWASGTGTVFDRHRRIGWTHYWSYFENGQAYLGFRIDTGQRDINYGWLLFSVGSGGSYMSISSWSGAAAGNAARSGNGAHSGPSGTPEPAAGGLALLALGAAGVLRHRRARQVA